MIKLRIVTKKLTKGKRTTMGLAASQARFLAITSRKASCEFESMSIAQQKLSVTRQLTEATKEYQSALNQTKLIWGMSDGLDAANPGQTYDLSYDVMMTPSALNDYEPTFITARNGKIVLNSKMAAAAEAAGIEQDGTTSPSGSTYANFIRQLGVQGYLATNQVSKLSTKVGNTYEYYNREAGIGGEPLDKTTANAMTLSTLINYVNQKNKEDGTGKIADSQGNPLSGTIYSNSSEVGDKGPLTIADLLTNNITYISTSKNTDEAWSNMEKILNALNGIFAEDIAGSEAFAYAKGEVESIIKKGATYDQGKATSANSVISDKSSEYNAWVSTSKKWGMGQVGYGISLSNMLKSFLTFYAQALGNFDTDYAVRDRMNESALVTSDPNYFYILKNTDAVTEKDLLVADFYSSLFNNICSTGWTTSAGNVDDKSYLSHAIKNGQLFVSSLSSDNNYYQEAYGLNDNIMEVTDEDGIAQAEAEYNAKKNQLNYKEEQLELDMKNIDTELSALTTEYDSVKNLISKNVEKVFTMFSS